MISHQSTCLSAGGASCRFSGSHCDGNKSTTSLPRPNQASAEALLYRRPLSRPSPRGPTGLAFARAYALKSVRYLPSTMPDGALVWESLPPELWLLILRCLDDHCFTWFIIRRVSPNLRRLAESAFAPLLLQNLTIRVMGEPVGDLLPLTRYK
jgi:hypothetical protein